MLKRLLYRSLWLFLLTFSVRLYVLNRLSGTPFFIPLSGDMRFYSDWGLRIAHGVFTDHRAFYGLPGYPFLLGFLFKILNFDRFGVAVVAALLQSVADAFTAVFIWNIALEAFDKKEDSRKPMVIGALAVLGWALYQPSQAFSAVLMPTALAVAIFWYCVWVLMRRQPFSVWKPWLPLGALIGLEAMIVATILFIVPMAFAAIFIRFRDSGTGRNWLKPLAAAAALIAGIYAGASPCWLHNYLVAHEPVMLSAHSGLNFYIGNNPDATGYPRMPEGMNAGQQKMLADSITIAEKAEGRPLKHYEVSRYWSAKAHAYILGHRVEWLRLMARKFGNFWDSFQYDDLSLITPFDNAGVLVPGPRFGWVAAMAVPGIFLALLRRRRDRAGWIVAAVLLHMAALMPVFVTERYRLAAAPGLLLLAAYGLWELWGFLSRARWVPALSYASVGLGAAFWIATPPAHASLWALDYYNTGIRAIDSKDYALARQDLEIAYAYVPGNAEVNFALGLLWQNKGDVKRAETFYQQAIWIDPGYVSAWNNLGVLASKHKAWPYAIEFFDKALEGDSSDAKAHYLRARACAEMGRWDEAKKSIERALSLTPGQKRFEALAAAIKTRGPLPED